MPPAAYACLITSGEATYDDLAARAGAGGEALGPAYFYIGPAWDADLVAGLDYHEAGAVEQADFLLAVGLFDEADPLESYDPLFGRARARGLPMVCVNPDLVVHRQSGVTSPCAGLLARALRRAGRPRGLPRQA